MLTRSLVLRFALAALIAGGTVLVGADAEAAAFVKYEGIDGESQDVDHDTWIDVLNVDWGIHEPGGGATGQSRRRGAAVVEDITLTMEYEKASPKIAESIATGKVHEFLKVDMCRADPGGLPSSCYLQLEATKVIISSYEVSGSGDEATIKATMNFEKVTIRYQSEDPTEPPTELTVDGTLKKTDK